jgi:hypothetical protein
MYEEGCFKTNLHVLAYPTACGSLTTTAWRVLGLRMEGRPPAMEGNCDYTEYATAESRQGVVLQLVDWAWA